MTPAVIDFVPPVTGRIGKIGRIWHRMYPVGEDKYLELLTIFPDNSDASNQVEIFLQSPAEKANNFQKLWPN